MKKSHLIISVTAAFAILLTLCASAAAPTVYASVDFETETIATDATTNAGGFTFMPTTNSLEVVSASNNKYLKMLRNGGGTANSECMLQVMAKDGVSDKHIFQFDIKFDSGVTNEGDVQVYGRKTTSAGTKYEMFLTISPDGNIKTSTGDTVGAINANTFTNIALAVNETAKTYSVYLNRQIVAENKSFTAAGYEGVSTDTLPTAYRIAMKSGTFKAAANVDNLKFYEGTALIAQETSTTTTAQGTNTTVAPGSSTTAPSTSDAVVFITLGAFLTASISLLSVRTRKSRKTSR